MLVKRHDLGVRVPDQQLQLEHAAEPQPILGWVVERFFAWINRNRRLAKGFEATIESVEAFLYAAFAVILLRRLAR